MLRVSYHCLLNLARVIKTVFWEQWQKVLCRMTISEGSILDNVSIICIEKDNSKHSFNAIWYDDLKFDAAHQAKRNTLCLVDKGRHFSGTPERALTSDLSLRSRPRKGYPSGILCEIIPKLMYFPHISVLKMLIRTARFEWFYSGQLAGN